MALFNVAQPVVDLIEARSPEEALRKLRKRLERAGFDLYEEETGPNAFESEPLSNSNERTTIESDRTAGTIQAIVGGILGRQVSVSQAGRLGNQVTIVGQDHQFLAGIIDALGADAQVIVTREEDGI